MIGTIKQVDDKEEDDKNVCSKQKKSRCLVQK